MTKLLVAIVLLCAGGAGAISQAIMKCPCDWGMCTAEASWRLRATSFTIPFSAIAGLSQKLGRAALLIPDVEIELDQTLHGTMIVTNCPQPPPENQCCKPGRSLHAATDVLLSGETKVFGIPPTKVKVTGVIRAAEVIDNESEDTNPVECEINAKFSVPVKGVKVTLVFAGFVRLPLVDVRGELEGRARVSCSCEGKPNAPPALSLPQIVRVPQGGKVQFFFEVKDPDNDPVWISRPETPKWLKITFDCKEGVAFIEAASDAPLGATITVNVVAYDLKRDERVTGDKPEQGQYYHEVPYDFTVEVVVANHPPQAISGKLVRSHGERICTVYAECKAEDPDLPENFGYDLFFRARAASKVGMCASLFLASSFADLCGGCKGEAHGRQQNRLG